jgi:branched-chain amino acid aminotransferase
VTSPELVWIDGVLCDPATARISPFDHGLTVGDGVFETMKVIDGEAFALRRHLVRLRRSAAGLGLAVPQSDDALRAAVHETIAANQRPSGRVRLTVTGGVGPLGSDRGSDGVSVILAVSPQAPWPTSASVVTVPWRRNEHSAVAGLKTTSYADNVVALRHAKEQGADEAIFANTSGNLCEGTGTNIFVGLETMPGWLRAIVGHNPVTHLTNAVRGLMHDRPVGADIVWVVAVSVVLTLVASPIALRMYHAER